MMTDKDAEQLFKDFTALPKAQPSNPTLQEIAGYPHYENVASNILAFFFNTEGVHNFKDLFVKSLLQCVDITRENMLVSNKIEREESTETRKRLDLIVVTDEFLIGIENKIFHTIQNDLDHYSAHLEGSIGQIEELQLKAVKIVLALRKSSDTYTLNKITTSGFIQVSYHEFFTKIRGNLGFYLDQAHPDYLIHLKEFIRTIENLVKSNSMNSSEIEFFEKYEDQYLELNQRYEQATYILAQKARDLKTKVRELSNGLLDMGIYKRVWVYWYSPLLNKMRVCIEAESRFNGWYLNISLRAIRYDIVSEDKQKAFAIDIDLFRDKGINVPNMRQGKIVVKILSITKTSADEMALEVIKLIELVEKSWPLAAFQQPIVESTDE